MRRRRAHGDAGTHHPDGRECNRVTIDAAAGGDEIVGLAMEHRAQRDLMDLAVAELLPVHVVRAMMQFDRPGTAGDGVVEAGALPHIIGRQGPSV